MSHFINVVITSLILPKHLNQPKYTPVEVLAKQKHQDKNFMEASQKRQTECWGNKIRWYPGGGEGKGQTRLEERRPAGGQNCGLLALEHSQGRAAISFGLMQWGHKRWTNIVVVVKRDENIFTNEHLPNTLQVYFTAKLGHLIFSGNFLWWIYHCNILDVVFKLLWPTSSENITFLIILPTSKNKLWYYVMHVIVRMYCLTLNQKDRLITCIRLTWYI